MAAGLYTCPECQASLRPTKPPPPGKKVKCPKCGAIFRTPEEAQPARAKQAASSSKRVTASPPKPDEPLEDEGMAVYAFKEKQAEDEKFEEERKRAALGVVLDRAPKSKRGPAMATVVMPSNTLLGAGLINCLIQLFCICIWIWPIIFSEHQLQPKEVLTESDGKEVNKDWQELNSNERIDMKQAEQKDTVIRCILVVCSILSFVYAGFIALGGVRMQNLESYGWAITACIMGIFPWCTLWVTCLFWPGLMVDSWWIWWFMYLPLGASVITIPAGLWCLITLRNPNVKEGYFEKPRY